MRLITFTSDPPLTEFAPNFNFVMAEDQLDFDGSDQFFINLRNIILTQEKNIIEEHKEVYQSYNKENNVVYDGDTGLGENSLTSRSLFYNIFNWNYHEIKGLQFLLHQKYVDFLKMVNVHRRKTWIQCWANVMRKGEKIEEHMHASHNLTWIGGHITVSCENTSTFYVNPIMTSDGKQIYESKNKPGQITLFQDCIGHYTSVHQGNTERISIAFDIILDERYQMYPKNLQEHFMVFDDV